MTPLPSDYMSRMEGLAPSTVTLIRKLRRAAEKTDVKAITAIVKKEAEEALFFACYMGDTDAVRLLLDAGAKVDGASNPGRVPLATAASSGSVSTVQLLLDRGATVDAPTSWGTPLRAAVHARRPEVAKLLLKHGANPAAQWLHGGSLADLARERDLPELVPLLSTDAPPVLIPTPTPGLPKRKPTAGEVKVTKAYDALVAKLTATAGKSTFKGAVSSLSRLTKSKPASEPAIPGITFFAMAPDKATEFVRDHHARFLAEHSAYLFLSVGSLQLKDLPSLALAPTADKYDLLLAMHTSAPSQGLDPLALIKGLQQIEKTAPFTLTQITPDVLSGHWTAAPKSPASVAKSLARLCPDLLEDHPTISSLAGTLTNGASFTLWWE